MSKCEATVRCTDCGKFHHGQPDDAPLFGCPDGELDAHEWEAF